MTPPRESANLSIFHQEGSAMPDIDYRIYYDLEQYLFRDVNSHFTDNQKLDAFDFFCIVIWKANRAKSRVASLLLKKFDDLERSS
jgi:hypothetical protein